MVKKFIGILAVASLLALALLAVVGGSAFAANKSNVPNTGGVVVGEGDAADCVGGACGGLVNEDPNGRGQNCDGGNCGGSVCAGSDCGSCTNGNCGGNISGSSTSTVKTSTSGGTGGGQLPRTGVTLPMASTIALGFGLVLVGIFFTFAGNPATKLVMGMKSYNPKRRA